MPFEPQNALEECLMAAVSPSARLRFYEELAKSVVYVITQAPVGTKNGVLEADTTVRVKTITMDENQYIPVFTSVLRIQQFVVETEPYLGMNSLGFFNLTKGADDLLNPGPEYGKTLSASEIASILDGSIGQPREQYFMEKETTVQIGVPADPPTELVSELAKLFRTMKEVRAAYNVLINNPEDGLGPHTLI